MTTMKMYAKIENASILRNGNWQEVVKVRNEWWPSGYCETYVFADRSREKACKCIACYVFNK